MNSKWYFSTLFLILCICFGAFQKQVVIPNQEIVVEFVDASHSKEDVSNTIADVKAKLVSIGASNISIQNTKKGTLKISYYSIVPVDNIKQVLSIVHQHQFAFNTNSDHEQKNLPSSTYNIDIYELTNEINTTNSHNKYIFEIKYISERSTTTKTAASIKNLENQEANQLFKQAYAAYKNNPFTKDRSSNKEPEVRAGPLFFYS